MASFTSAGNVKRRTSSAASHRRPFWAKTEKSLKLYIENPRGSESSAKAHSLKVVDYGIDNFSYDPDQLAAFVMPANLPERIPHELLDKTIDWQKAGAALCTTLNRISLSYNNAVNSAFPHRSKSVSFGTSSDEQATSGAAVSSPPESPLSPSPIKALTLHQLEKLTTTARSEVTLPMGMESPPYTPFDASSYGSPVSFEKGKEAANLIPDLALVDNQLSPLPSLELMSSAYSPISWEYFTKQYDEQLRDCKIAYQRVRGYGRTIDIMLIELSRVMKPEIKLATIDYRKWWESLQLKVSELRKVVETLKRPTLDNVTQA
ncbi:hypothetical protein BAUCODRAFT_31453 [Baudoinia panamericana UAMH 10762]|uniref:Uncharacterized protein n=1 Tax=Baudoinia panamericana (strain UAMH 10762) TaxID=717646 RepID=M2NJ46_BAUPA|nr:uncharacterized protein BAUCODRAFT_31453 [Baudoinia panamericana UAMH 10762]EMC99140.1 hypothetical protein BAUCODRAFT_31453 [Baudoinia panamericana UAMH 10762]